ncbi:MAG: hypothetical protein K6B52_08825, partial [Clostridiales bacterium]|nr:hypothetical protein [Clostridiales bacterium]
MKKLLYIKSAAIAVTSLLLISAVNLPVFTHAYTKSESADTGEVKSNVQWTQITKSDETSIEDKLCLEDAPCIYRYESVAEINIDVKETEATHSLFSTEEEVNSSYKSSPDDNELPFMPDEPEHEHVWDDGVVTTEPTCKQEGVKTYTCKIDSSHTKTETIPPKEHTPSEPVRENVVLPTNETEGGFDEVVYCSVCHEEISREHKITPKTGDNELPFLPDESEHKWNEGVVTTEPTCTQEGIRTYTCIYNSSHTKTETIPATGHKPSGSVRENVVLPTDESEGGFDEVVYCSVCHVELSRVHKTELSFLEGEVMIIIPDGAIPEDSVFDVQKIIPAPEQVVDTVHDQLGSDTPVAAYYEIRL